MYRAFYRNAVYMSSYQQKKKKKKSKNVWQYYKSSIFELYFAKLQMFFLFVSIAVIVDKSKDEHYRCVKLFFH